MIIEQRVCDLCHHVHGDMTEATVTRTVTVDKRAIELDLCEPDDKALTNALAPFFEVGRRIGRRPAREPREPREAPPVPTDGFECKCGRTFATQRGLNRHVLYPPAASADDHEVAA